MWLLNRSSGLLCCVVGQFVSDIPKKPTAIIVRFMIQFTVSQP